MEASLKEAEEEAPETGAASSGLGRGRNWADLSDEDPEVLTEEQQREREAAAAASQRDAGEAAPAPEASDEAEAPAPEEPPRRSWPLLVRWGLCWP